MPDNNSKIYGLIGFPLGHSFSQRFFNDKFLAEHINAEYINFELPDISDLMELISEYPAISGLNVTIPYKQQIMGYLDDIDAEAAVIGAVNVIKLTTNDNGSLHMKGYNTDIIGFTDSIRPLIRDYHTKALILGTGGASKAVFHGLQNLGIKATLVSRTPGTDRLTYTDLTPDIIEQYKIIVNTTPLGMYPDENKCPPIPYDHLTQQHLCCDLVYNPEMTLFMRKSADKGASVKNGLDMLHRQAIAAWHIWNRNI